MNEDRENEEKRARELADHTNALPVDEFTRSLLKKRIAKPTFKRVNKNANSVSLKGKYVNSIYNTRLINAQDFLLEGVVNLTDPTSCALLTTDPGPPYTDDRPCYPNGTYAVNNQQVSGCTANTYHGENCIAATSIEWKIRDINGSTGLYNAYLFNTAGALLQSDLGISIPLTLTTIFTVNSPSANDEFTFVITGQTSSDISTSTVEIHAVRTP